MPEAVEKSLPQPFEVLLCQVVLFGQPDSQSLQPFLPGLVVDGSERSGKLAIAVVLLHGFKHRTLALALRLLVHQPLMGSSR